VIFQCNVSTINKNTGFTFIEVLIAVVLLAGGLLGLAALQATSLKNNQSAYNRSQATQLAYELADRIRANTAGLAVYTGAKGANPSTALVKPNCLTTTGCSAADMAENDLYEWNCAIAGGCEGDTRPITPTLPGGAGNTATITVPSAGIFKISIKWNDDPDGYIGDSHTFETSFSL
jgi:type IV pilus assembly protein PilV